MESLDSSLSRNLELYFFDENGRGLFYYDVNNDDYNSEVDKQLISGLLVAINRFAHQIQLGAKTDTLRVIKGSDEFRIMPSEIVFCGLKINGSEGVGKKTYDKIDSLVHSIIRRIIIDYSSDLTKFNYEGSTEAFWGFGDVIKQEIVRKKQEVINHYLSEIMIKGNLTVEKQELDEKHKAFNDSYKSVVLNNDVSVKNELLINELISISEYNSLVRESLSNLSVILSEVISEVNAETRPLCDFFKVRQIG